MRAPTSCPWQPVYPLLPRVTWSRTGFRELVLLKCATLHNVVLHMFFQTPIKLILNCLHSIVSLICTILNCQSFLKHPHLQVTLRPWTRSPTMHGMHVQLPQLINTHTLSQGTRTSKSAPSQALPWHAVADALRAATSKLGHAHRSPR